jgi:predicted amidophosphoribosyltransferase
MKLSPQSRWAKKQKRRGYCARCGNKRNRYRQLCDVCQAATTAYMRAWRKRQKEKLNDNPGNDN